MSDESIASLGIPGSFTDYSSMMMNPYTMNMMNPYMLHPYLMNGGTGSYNPAAMMVEWQKMIQEAQREGEKRKLEHAVDMHKANQIAEVQNLSIHERAFFEKAMVDDDVNTSIRNLYDVIRIGDQNAICEEFDKVQRVLLTKFGDYFRTADGGKNITAKIQGHISDLYSKKAEAWTGAPADLRKDIRDYGESAFMWGFNKNFFDKRDYHDKYTEQTLNYLFGTRIDNKRGKDRMAQVGGVFGGITEGLTCGVLGGAGGAAAGGALVGLGRLLGIGKNIFRLPGTEEVKDAAGKVMKDSSGNPIMKKIAAGSFWKALKHGGRLGAIAGICADIWWQYTRSA